MVRDSSVTRGVEQSQRAPGGGADHWVTWVCVVLGADTPPDGGGEQFTAESEVSAEQVWILTAPGVAGASQTHHAAGVM